MSNPETLIDLLIEYQSNEVAFTKNPEKARALQEALRDNEFTKNSDKYGIDENIGTLTLRDIAAAKKRLNILDAVEVTASKGGHGKIDSDEGYDYVRISAGEYYEIRGFEDNDGEPTPGSNFFKKLLSSLVIPPFQEHDSLEMIIPCDKQHCQQVEYFKRGEHTYVQIYDKEAQNFVAAAKFKDSNYPRYTYDGERGVRIDVLLEDGSKGKPAVELFEKDSPQSLEAAMKIDLLIARGQAKEAVKNTGMAVASEESYNKGLGSAKTNTITKK